MHILILRSFPTPANLVKKTYNIQAVGLAKALLKLGHQVTIVFCGDKKNDTVVKTEYGEIKVFYIKPKILLFKFVCVLPSIDKFSKNADLIITSEYSQIDSFKLCKKYGSRVIIYHGPYFDESKKKYNAYAKVFDFIYLKKYLKLNPNIFTKSELAKEYLIKKGFHVISSLGVGLDREGLNSLLCSSTEINRVTKNKNLLYIGVIEQRRNTLFLLDLIERLHKVDENYKLTIIGKGDGDYYKKCISRIATMKEYVNHITVVEQKNLMSYYQSASFLLLPTNYEIWGMTLMEAMNFSVPIITTLNGGSSSLIKNEVNGFIRTLNVDEWYDTICSSSINYSELEKTNDELLKKFSWDNIAKSMLDYENNK